MKKYYLEAFKQALKCNGNDFEYQPYSEEDKDYNSFLFKYKESTYRADSLDDLHHQAEIYLTTESAMYVSPYIISDIMENVHIEIEFYEKLHTIISKEEKLELNYTLGLYNATKEGFWDILYRLTHSELYAKAINTATKMYDLNCLKIEFVELLIENGENELSVNRDGLFEEIEIIDSESNEQYFYVYDTDNLFD